MVPVYSSRHHHFGEEILLDVRSAMYGNRYRNLILVATVPVFVFYVSFIIVPIGMSFFYSLFDWAGFTDDMLFLGMDNYASLILKDGLFAKTVINSLKYVFVGGAVIFAITLLFTYCISSFRCKGLRTFYRCSCSSLIRFRLWPSGWGGHFY